MNAKIILFSIGSVQNFIIDSRKVSDLLNSSKMVSNLIKISIEKIKNEYNGELILPCINGENNNLPNYFIAKCSGDYDLEELKKELIENIVSNLHKNIKKYSSCKLSDIQINQMKDHIYSLFDFNWVEYELKNENELENDDSYKEIYKNIYRYFEGDKEL